MVIDLTSSEKSTYLRFLFLYLGSSFVLMIFIATLYYQNEKILYYDLTKSNMQNEVSKISSLIILSHMGGNKFDKEKLLETENYKISFYDKNQNKIFGNLDENINFSKKIIDTKNSFILVDDSVLGHLDIYYIALKENMYFKKIEELKLNIISIFFIIYLIIALIGFYLAKLFLRPIREERVKLNNFIKDTTHELNTPISAILMSTENKNLSEKQIERVRISAKRVSEIYSDLTYLFLENKETIKNIQEFNLKDLISEQMEYLDLIATKKRVKINKTIEDFDYKIDKDDFIRIFNNLVSNAIKYNKISGVIDISLKNNILKISDSGIGIEKDKINDIYKRYYRATNEQGGFGIGLNIVSYICSFYKIKITVDSQINKGTTFSLTF
ncbi:sensor histidine kinase [Arcobacter suis]|uniref:histidine kinase n=2 Tax=Arcobacter suis TaxID=1278212 RepID=A0AAD0SN83_9BACT|nr:HAMP domain-containing sensor histidine kinase [Arcobacter suis]AXX88629.1 two-component system sensor histidine kinase, putative CusS [Arcobacter suis CECT 7833]